MGWVRATAAANHVTCVCVSVCVLSRGRIRFVYVLIVRTELICSVLTLILLRLWCAILLTHERALLLLMCRKMRLAPRWSCRLKATQCSPAAPGASTPRLLSWATRRTHHVPLSGKSAATAAQLPGVGIWAGSSGNELSSLGSHWAEWGQPGGQARTDACVASAIAAVFGVAHSAWHLQQLPAPSPPQSEAADERYPNPRCATVDLQNCPETHTPCLMTMT